MSDEIEGAAEIEAMIKRSERFLKSAERGVPAPFTPDNFMFVIELFATLGALLILFARERDDPPSGVDPNTD